MYCDDGGTGGVQGTGYSADGLTFGSGCRGVLLSGRKCGGMCAFNVGRRLWMDVRSSVVEYLSMIYFFRKVE